MSHPLFHRHPVFSQEVRQRQAAIVTATIILSLSAVFALGVPLAVKRLAEQWSAGNPWLPWLLAGGLGLILSLALQAYGRLRSVEVSERLKAALQRQLFGALLGKEMAFHRAHGPGELVSAIYTDIQAVAGLYSQLLPRGLSGVLMLVGATIALLKLSPGLAIVLGAATLVALLFSRLLLRRIRSRATELNEHASQVYRVISEALHQVLVIRINDLTDWTSRRLERDHERMVELTVRLQFLQGMLAMAVQLLLATALLLGWILLTRAAGEGALGTQLSALLFGLLMVRQIGNLAGLLATYRQAQGAMDRLDTLLGTDEPMTGGAELVPLFESLRIEMLSFSYGVETALEDVSFEVQRGEKIAVTGPNGAGKTTLFNLIAMLEPAPSGNIFWNNTDITGFERRALLQKIAYLPQDSLLSQATIAENIRMGCLEASDGEVLQAAKRAGVLDVIERHGDGLNTVLGSEGSRISGGEKRRIALARLLIRQDAELYLLDEPTEGLDADSETAILTTALQALEGKTVLIITHRPAVLDRVDRHIRFERGRLIQG